MNILKFRVVMDTPKDVFRDIEIASEQTFEELHVAIIRAFELSGEDLASFYLSDQEWTKGEEITYADMGFPDNENPLKLMKNCILDDFIVDEKQRLLYVYNFMQMWCFMIELIGEQKANPEFNYPLVSLKVGDAPKKLTKDSMIETEEELPLSKQRIDDEISDMFSDLDEE